VSDDRAANSHEKPITLVDLLTPSEKELAREQLFLPEENQERGKRANFMSHLKSTKKVDVQKAFKLTSHQLKCVSLIPSRFDLSIQY